MLGEQDPKFRVRGYQPGDEHGIVRLFQRTFEAPFDLDVWRWKYQQSPWACPALSTLAQLPDGEIIGHFGVMLLAVNQLGKPRVHAQCTDFMIDAAHRGQQMFRELVRVAYSNAASHGAPVFTGFPRQQALGPMRQVARHVAVLDKLHLPLGSANHARLREQVAAAPDPTRSGFELNPEYALDARFDALWQSCARLENLSVWKDRQFMSWRYLQGPSRHRFLTLELRGEVVALGVCRERIARATLFELLVRDKHVHIARELLLRIADHYQGRGFSELGFTGSDAGFFREVFSAFENRPASFESFFAHALDPETAYFYENPLNWTLTRGDSDA